MPPEPLDDRSARSASLSKDTRTSFQSSCGDKLAGVNVMGDRWRKLETWDTYIYILSTITSHMRWLWSRMVLPLPHLIASKTWETCYFHLFPNHEMECGSLFSDKTHILLGWERDCSWILIFPNELWLVIIPERIINQQGQRLLRLPNGKPNGNMIRIPAWPAPSSKNPSPFWMNWYTMGWIGGILEGFSRMNWYPILWFWMDDFGWFGFIRFTGLNWIHWDKSW